MPMITRLLGLYSMLIAFVVGVYFIISPFVTADWGGDLWDVLNYFMVAGTTIVLGAAFMDKRCLEAGTTDVIQYIRTYVAFYSALLLFMWFFWKWFSVLNGDDSDSLSWTFVDPLFAIVVGSIGRRMWRNAAGL